MLTKIYHGSGYKGGGIIYLICQMLLNNGNIICNGDEYSSGGSIFICSKYIINNGKISCIGYGGKKGKTVGEYGFIGLYCNIFLNNGLILPSSYYLNNYKNGNNINKIIINNILIFSVYYYNNKLYLLHNDKGIIINKTNKKHVIILNKNIFII